MNSAHINIYCSGSFLARSTLLKKWDLSPAGCGQSHIGRPPSRSWFSDPRATPSQTAWLQSLAPLGVATMSIFILSVRSAVLFPLGPHHAEISASEPCLRNSDRKH